MDRTVPYRVSLAEVDSTGDLVEQPATGIAAGGAHTCAILATGRVKCWGANGSGQLGLGDTENRGDVSAECGRNLASVSLRIGSDPVATAVTAGRAHTCVLFADGLVKCWGDSGMGQLGLENPADRGDNPSEMGTYLPFVSLGSERTATALDAGSDHTCATLDDLSLKCWGLNQSGQLGLGDGTSRGDEPGEMGSSLPAVALW